MSGRRVAGLFREHFGIAPARPDRELLAVCGAAFARLPYENLTKLIRKHRCPPGPGRRRAPDTVLGEHVTLGAGGTCFALANFFCAVLRGLGFDCDVLLADMRNRPRSHCALLVQLAEGPQLLDPAYLVTAPLALRAGQVTAAQGITVAQLETDAAARCAELHTDGKWRYRVHLAPPSGQELLAAWDASFDWTMMNDLHVCGTSGGGYAYLHGHKLRCQQGPRKQTLNVRGDEARVLGERFGIAAQLVEQARALVAAARGAAAR